MLARKSLSFVCLALGFTLLTAPAGATSIAPQGPDSGEGSLSLGSMPDRDELASALATRIGEVAAQLAEPALEESPEGGVALYGSLHAIEMHLPVGPPPVSPEPGTVALLGLGLAGLAAFRPRARA
jgi:hypothetical protein